MSSMRKGSASVKFTDGSIRQVELHWYEATGIGRNEYKIKLDTNLFDPTDRRRLKLKHKNNLLKKKKHPFNGKKSSF